MQHCRSCGKKLGKFPRYVDICWDCYWDQERSLRTFYCSSCGTMFLKGHLIDECLICHSKDMKEIFD